MARAKEMGVAGLVVGGIHDKDLRALLGYDLGVAITGTEQVGFTLILTEGFGTIPMAAKTFSLLSAHAGQQASISGATQIRAGVIRPEIIIPKGAGASGGHGAATVPDVRAFRSAIRFASFAIRCSEKSAKSRVCRPISRRFRPRVTCACWKCGFPMAARP